LIRAVFLDARADAAAFPALVRRPEATCAVRILNASRTHPGAQRGLARSTRDAVVEARGVDVVVVVAGSELADIARDGRICVAAGARAAVVANASATRSDELERGVRHLLVGAGLVGDDAGSVDANDAAALHDVIARAAAPVHTDGFIAAARPGTKEGALY